MLSNWGHNMGFFSNLDTSIQEMKQNRGLESVKVGSIGVCLADSGQPVRLYIVDTVYSGSSLDVFSLDDDFAPGGLLIDGAKPRQVESADFWCLV